jgi:hypothetical protein
VSSWAKRDGVALRVDEGLEVRHLQVIQVLRVISAVPPMRISAPVAEKNRSEPRCGR